MGFLSGLFGKAKAPPVPDFGALNTQQVQQNKDAAYDVMGANRYGQQTPFASNQWVTDPNTGQVTNTTALAPEQQALYAKNNALAQAMSGDAGGALNSFMGQYWNGGGAPAGGGGGGYSISGGGAGNIPGTIQNDLDYSNLTAMPTTDPAQARQQAQDALYKMQSQYLDPQWQESQRSLSTKLSNQGLVAGTPAYNRAMQVENDAQQKAYANAQQTAIAGGGAEAERAQNMALQLRNQGIGEAGNLGAFHNAAQNQGANQYLTELGQQRSLQGTLAGVNASMANAQANNALQQRSQQFNELMSLQRAGQGGQILPQFGTSQGNLGQYGAGNAVGAAQQQYQDQAAAAQAKNQSGLGGMLPALAGAAGTYFGGPLLGALGKQAGGVLGKKLFGASPSPVGYTSPSGYGDSY